ncbi:MAG TPA: DinB family protein [Balneolaceae bacterium]|nr:DinB family protein [Balneolaceae bacterium]
MDTFSKDLQALYNRDVERLLENLEAIPDHMLWETRDGITNSCGVLVQHLVGNLNYFIGSGLGNTGYVRDREREFKVSNKSRDQLIQEVRDLRKMLNATFEHLDESDLASEYPMEIPFDYSTREFLVHLYGHLNYHLGQLNYLRRILTD